MGSIPLVALMGQQYQPESLLSAVGKAQAIKSSQQQQEQSSALLPGELQQQNVRTQLGQQAVQSGALDLAQRKAINDAWKQAVTTDPTTGMLTADPNKLQSALAASGAGEAIPAITKGLMDMQKTAGELAAQKSSIASAEQDAAGDGAQAVLASGLDPNVKNLFFQHMQSAGYGTQAQQLQQHLAQFQNNPQAETQIWKALVAQSPKQQALATEAATAAAKTSEAATQAKKEQFEESMGGTSPEMIQMRDWLAKHPGQGASDYQIAMKKLPITMQSDLLSPDAKAMAAEMYQQTGTLPQGMRSPAMSAGILNQAAQGGPQNIAGAKANYAANTDSLKSLQKNFDQVTAFENTAGKNLDQFLATAKNVVDSGSPLINQPLRSVADKVAGSPNQAAFDAARVTALTEIAKVLNSSNASGVLSDSARSEVSGLIGKDATLAQIYKAAQILKTDMANRHDAYQQQIGTIQSRIGGGAQPQQKTQQTAKDLGPAPQGAKEGETGKFNGVPAKIVNGRIVPQ